MHYRRRGDAKKALEILNAWSATLKKMDGHDVQLGAGLNGFKFVNAAELMRATYPKWTAQEIEQCQKMLKEAVYPPIKDFATFANGNWDGACIKTMMAIGVFCDDHEMFNRGSSIITTVQGMVRSHITSSTPPDSVRKADGIKRTRS